MTDLSPAAQAVLDAYEWNGLAAALIVAADQFSWDEDFTGMCCCEHLKAIAAELENTND